VVETYLNAARTKLRPRSFTEVQRYLRQYWKPLHNASIYKITRRMVTQRVGEIAREQGSVAALRARSALSALFSWAIKEGLEIQSNPVLGSNAPPEPRSRDRVLNDAELARIWRAAGDDDYGRIIKLLMLTGARRNEVGGMRWEELSEDEWTLPAARTKNGRQHTIPLPAAALALLPEPNGREGLMGRGDFGDGVARSAD
jgi:integrase